MLSTSGVSYMFDLPKEKTLEEVVNAYQSALDVVVFNLTNNVSSKEDEES